MPKSATPADAQVILQLYDLRREAEMRKARSWWFVSFWPQSADDFMKVVNEVGMPENAWLRQVIGYWDLAAALRNVYRLCESAALIRRVAEKDRKSRATGEH